MPEPDCPECSGAGFFGSGPYVEFCKHCGGLGVLNEGSAYRFLDRKDFGLAGSADGKADSKLRAKGERTA